MTYEQEWDILREALRRAKACFKTEKVHAVLIPPNPEAVLEKIAKWMDKQGIQTFGVEGAAFSTFDGFSYVNRGDTYLATLLWDGVNDRFLLTSWGSFVEEMEAFGYRTQ